MKFLEKIRFLTVDKIKKKTNFISILLRYPGTESKIFILDPQALITKVYVIWSFILFI